MASRLVPPSVTLYTIGHGAVALEQFLSYVSQARIASIVDVRRFPSSRRHPQFSAPALAESLERNGVAYRHAEALGGRRKPLSDSPNPGLRNDGFRGYADWMLSDDFRGAFAALVDAALQTRTAVMCAETPWWKCHRRLIADATALVAGGTVLHVMGAKLAQHVPTTGVCVENGRLFYR